MLTTTTTRPPSAAAPAGVAARPIAVPGSVPPGGAAGEDAWSMVGTDRKAGHVSLLWESVIAHLGLSVRPRWLPDTRDDHDLCGGSSGLIAALTASASSRLTGTSIVIRTTILSPLMAPSVSADPHQSDPVEMGWQSCGDLALIDLVLAMGYGHTAEVIEALFRCRQPRSFSPSAVSSIYCAFCLAGGPRV